ncbi:MAG: HD-GYP domain-containing protein [Candidatus Omnitrophica bacterium]|nr:HD-GYP domain-containing protein [Candidatus Omnitrophota bacterium]
MKNDWSNTQKILTQAAKGISVIKDMQKLLNLIVYIVKKHIKSKSACIFQYEEEFGAFILKSSRGQNRILVGYRIGHDNRLVDWLKKKKVPFLYKDLNILPALKQELKKLDCAICVPSFWDGELLGFLILGEKCSGDSYTKEELSLLSTLSNEVAVAMENAKNFMALEKLKEREKESYFQTVLALARTVDEKDAYTRGHLDGVARYGVEVAQELSKSKDIKISMEELNIALLLHDIGKIGVPDALLNKNGSLTSEEWVVMKQHPEIGERIIEPINKLRNVGKIVRHHQEKYDGTGYPDGLKGLDIPPESRIIAVVDAYHAMVSDRPYRKALSEKVALKELKDNSGTHFDPIVVDAFIRAWKKGKIKKV